MINVQLDKKNDILYITLSDMSNSYGDEDDNGNVIFRDLKTDRITGITIFDFIMKYDNMKIRELKLPVAIDFETDVFPSLGLH